MCRCGRVAHTAGGGSGLNFGVGGVTAQVSNGKPVTPTFVTTEKLPHQLMTSELCILDEMFGLNLNLTHT